MIYLDTPVVLAQRLAEGRQPPADSWTQPADLQPIAGAAAHACNLGASHGEEAKSLLARLGFLELVPPVLARLLEPWPRIRTLDALHLASMAFLVDKGQPVVLASYDDRQVAVARALGFRDPAVRERGFPPGWSEERVRAVISHYENQSEEEALAEDEAAFEDRTQTVMEVPTELVPAIRHLITEHQRGHRGQR